MEPLMKELCPIEPYNECCDIENPGGVALNSCKWVQVASILMGGETAETSE